jgi:hypothetical protein
MRGSVASLRRLRKQDAYFATSTGADRLPLPDTF